jgi:hypothetical protein
MIRPAVVLEIGSLWGHSARCFLEGGAQSVIAVDLVVTPQLLRLAAAFPNLQIVRDRQESFPLDVLGGRGIDLLFLDASHEFELDCQTFLRLRPHLQPKALVIVHDTAPWRKALMKDCHREQARDAGIDCGEYHIHQPDAVRLVEWLNGQGLSCINLGSEGCLRHGLSIFQYPCRIEPVETGDLLDVWVTLGFDADLGCG